MCTCTLQHLFPNLILFGILLTQDDVYICLYRIVLVPNELDILPLEFPLKKKFDLTEEKKNKTVVQFF